MMANRGCLPHYTPSLSLCCIDLYTLAPFSYIISIQDKFLFGATTIKLVMLRSKPEDNSILDPPGYIKPSLQALFLTYITAEEPLNIAERLGVEYLGKAGVLPVMEVLKE
jgi:hypothetical protein